MCSLVTKTQVNQRYSGFHHLASVKNSAKKKKEVTFVTQLVPD